MSMVGFCSAPLGSGFTWSNKLHHRGQWKGKAGLGTWSETLQSRSAGPWSPGLSPGTDTSDSQSSLQHRGYGVKEHERGHWNFVHERTIRANLRLDY